MKHALCLATLTAATLALTACGGSSDTSHSAIPAPHPNNTSATAPSNIKDIYKLSHADYAVRPLRVKVDFKKSVNGKSADDIELGKLPLGFSSHTVDYQGSVKDNNQPLNIKETLRIYHQPNSVVIAGKLQDFEFDGKPQKGFAIFRVYGNYTKTLPTAGTFNYVGKSFDQDSEGSFNYAIDFGNKTGKGSLTLDSKTTALGQANIVSGAAKDGSDAKYAIEGIASGAYEGRYGVGIFGDNAQELSGFIATNDNTTIGLSGNKQ